MNLNQVTLPTLDLNTSVPFYQKLGLSLIVRSSPNYARFSCPVGDSTFSLHLVKELPSGEGVTIYFECENLDERVDELKKLGVLFDTELVDQSWLWREASLRDPDGNKIILFYAGENRLNPPWKLD